MKELINNLKTLNAEIRLTGIIPRQGKLFSNSNCLILDSWVSSLDDVSTKKKEFKHFFKYLKRKCNTIAIVAIYDSENEDEYEDNYKVAGLTFNFDNTVKYISVEEMKEVIDKMPHPLIDSYTVVNLDEYLRVHNIKTML